MWRSVGKKMLDSSFALTGDYATIVLEDNKTVTAHWDTNNYLSLILEKVCEKRPRSMYVEYGAGRSAAPPQPRRRTIPRRQRDNSVRRAATLIVRHSAGD
ncbi:hypothetical protein EVAR_59040_1 [Eumeta japonica]|uniref:Uncharacterized protein n=1 Tax=Eumeta variegata TaxID=151549 RepID=A0A4C1ZCQ3_EUMVA|nr:hypothetical protein EVAR_59040_1 [Eumeta japonica]